MDKTSIKLSLCFLLLFMIFTQSALAQSIAMTGTVTDDTGEPLIGVNVLVKGTTVGTVTNIDGKYTIQVSGNQVLAFSYIGFLPQEIAVGNRRTIDVILKEDAQSLEEVVVVGYGVQKKSQITGAISQVKAEDMENRAFSYATQALQGKTSGVQNDLTYYFAGSALSNDGPMITSKEKYGRYTGTINGTYQVKKWLQISTSNNLRKRSTRNIKKQHY